MNVAEVIEQQARTRPEAAAIIDVRSGRERVFTFAELSRRAAQLAATLQSHGIEPGEGALILHPMCAELYVFVLALFRLRVVGVFLDVAAERQHIQHACSTFQVKAFFGSNRAHLLRLISPAIRRIPLHYSTSRMPGSFDISSSRSRTEAPAIASATEEDAPALITFTSGSTGTPRAAARTHRFLLAQHKAVERGMELGAGQVSLTTLPVFVLANLVSGVTSVLPDSDIRHPELCDYSRTVAQISRHKVTSAVASPAFIERLTEYCGRASCSVAGLEKLFIGGAPVFPGVLRRAQKTFPNAVITAAYGSTEAEPIAEIPLPSIGEDDFCCMNNGGGLLAGSPVPGIELRVIREQWGRPIGRVTAAEFAAMVLPVDEPGEIVVSGEHVLRGYLRGEGDVETKFDVHTTRWHRTGDLGYLDSRERLWLLGRCSAKIQDARGVLYPLAVECALRHDRRITCVAVVAFRGERVLVVQRREGQVVDSVTPAWASIDRVIAVKRIPMDRRHHAKVDYPKLQCLLRRRI